MTSSVSKVLAYNETTTPLPSNTLEPSGESTRRSWSVATNYLEEL
jgi:hypothetical protein